MAPEPRDSPHNPESEPTTETLDPTELAVTGDKFEFAAGEMLASRFRILRPAGRGGMGVVYEAIDEKLERRVALKCAGAHYAAHLTPEVRNASEVSHPNICRIFEIHTASTRFGELDFITMEYLEGETLSKRLRKGPLAEKERRLIARQLAAGLAEAHRNHIIHGDIKSNNVILTSGASRSIRAVITDFGLAQHLGMHLRQGCGTRGYMASELWSGEPTSERSDIYALGIVLFEMVAGRPPWQLGDGTEAGEKDWEKLASRLPPPVAMGWDRILARCLDPDASRRYRDATELLSALAPSRTRARAVTAIAAVVLASVTGLVTYRNATAPPDTVKLAVLPFAVDGPALPGAAGLADEVATRLSGARRQFTVYSSSDLRRMSFLSAEGVRSGLGATHALRVRLNTTNPAIRMDASLTDLASGRNVSELHAEYSPRDTGIMASALVGIVAGAFHLKAIPENQKVSPAAYAFYIQGTELLSIDNMNPDPAIPLLEKAVALDPQSPDALAELASALVDKFLMGGGKDYLDQAEQRVEAARKLDPDSSRVLLASGLVKQQRGQYEAAIRDFARATERQPSSAEAWRQLAVGYDNGNRSREAIAAYRKAIELSPASYRPHLDFGNFYYYRADFPQAEQEWRRAVSLAPRVPVAHMNLGLALLQQEKLADAEASILEAVRLRVTSDALMNLGVVYYRQRKFSEAATSFEASLHKGVPGALQYRNLGDALRQMGQTARGRDAYRKALSLAEAQVSANPRRAIFRAFLGVLAARTGDLRRAQSEASQALALEPENASVLREAVITFEAIGDRSSTLQLLSPAPPQLLFELSHNPDVPELRTDQRFLAMLKATEKK